MGRKYQEPVKKTKARLELLDLKKQVPMKISSVTSLCDRRLTVPNITAQQYHRRVKLSQHLVQGEDSVKLAYIVEFLSRNHY